MPKMTKLRLHLLKLRRINSGLFFFGHGLFDELKAYKKWCHFWGNAPCMSVYSERSGTMITLVGILRKLFHGRMASGFCSG